MERPISLGAMGLDGDGRSRQTHSTGYPRASEKDVEGGSILAPSLAVLQTSAGKLVDISTLWVPLLNGSHTATINGRTTRKRGLLAGSGERRRAAPLCA